MKFVFEVPDEGAIRLRVLNDDGSPAQDFPRVLRMTDACRWLKRSRRHLYRYVARGWLRPVAKFSGEFFFDVKDLESYQRGPGPRRASLPGRMAALFPEYDIRTLQPER